MGMRRNKTNTGEVKEKLTKERLTRAARIFRYIRPYKWSFIVGMLLLSTSSLLFMVFPGAAGEMANVANGSEPKFDLSLQQFGLFFLILLIVQGVFSYLRTILFANVSEKGMADVRKALYQSLITQDVPFFEQRRVGELTSRITSDVEKLQTAFSITLAEFIRQLITLVAGIAIIAWLTPHLSYIMLLTFPVVVIIAMIFGRYIRQISKKRQDELANTNVIVEETLQSFTVVKSFTNEWYEALRYGRSIDKVVQISLKFARTRGLFFIFIITVLFGAIFFILWRGALLVQSGEMQVGDLFSFILYTAFIGGAIGGLGNLYTELISAIGATERIQEILDRPGEVQPSSVPLQPHEQFTGAITYRDVAFRYPSRPDMEVLRGINLRIEPGQKVALVGASGAGKSTIVQLLLQFYKIDEGAILVDGKSIYEYDLLKYRQNIAIVPQEVLLFGGTIRENILYGKPSASDAEVTEAAQQANAWDFIQSFPDGLDTIVGERGVKLSGGQRQRIAIARAILKDPAILLLDEATSSLDAESEKLVQEALTRLMEGRTSIIIAHRLATIRDVDCIYVLENGRIIEQGTHQELSLREDGVYNTLAKLQFEIA
ncbi:MAG TPA: ABC transporter transmembrane domain-containing protein [Saprospiraceae bacterium]|nr:ABC transporter transmembrane domain-containing protein [Saprospiraceae bacterium]HMP23256.1 ABC transporter transmembrane domain-containing protein [Saprospiraceae bacterium]